MADDDDAKIKFTLKGAGLAVEREVNAATASGLLQLVLGGEASGVAASLPQNTPRVLEKREPRLSFREFLDQVQPKSNPEKMAAFACYLRDCVGEEDASKEEIRACFRSAGEPLPRNFHRDFTNCVQSGWIAEDPARAGRFYLTRKGEEFIKRR